MIGLWQNVLFRELFMAILLLHLFILLLIRCLELLKVEILEKLILKNTNNISLPFLYD